MKIEIKIKSSYRLVRKRNTLIEIWVKDMRKHPTKDETQVVQQKY